ncbi:MAG: arylsulfatase [Bacteroidales bacterium]|nr:arylsulfatase [Bacteroidales bacterium]
MRKDLLACAAMMPAALATLQSHAQNRSREDRPNVIIILADDLGYGDLGCYGARNVVTPNVDAVASKGVRFVNAYATASVSTPSRYSILTGQYAWRRDDTDIAVGDAGMIIRPEQYTIADLFKNAGYSTAAFGKWHLGLGDKGGEQDWNAPLPAGLGDIGFDYSYIMAATGDRVPCVFIENGQVVDWDPSAPIEVSYRTPFEGEPLAADHPELLYNLKSTPGVGHNQAIVNGIGRIGYMKGGGRALWKDENIADSITVHALRFIESHKDEPFFMYLATNDVHVPRFPHERFRGMSGMGLRGDAIAEFDWTVGSVTGALSRLGLEDNTILIITSDNGPVLEDGYMDRAAELLNGHDPSGNLRGNKYGVYEAGARVPAIVRWPGKVTEGALSEAIVSQLDLFRSFGAMLDQRIPKGGAPDSRDALPAWLGRDPFGREYVIEQANNRALSVRTKEWKYVDQSEGPAEYRFSPGSETGYMGEPQLFHLTTDPKERDNVAKDHPDVVASMVQILQRERGCE